MKSHLEKVFQHAWGAWRFRWMALVVAWAAALCGWVLIDRVEDQYVATARIVVDTNQVLKPLLKDLTIQNDVNQRVALMGRTLLNRPNLEYLISTTGLEDRVVSDLAREQLLSDLKRDISLSGTYGNDSLYALSFTHADPVMAKQVVQSLINVFIDKSIGGTREDNSSAQAFLDVQIVDYENRLKEAEKRLAAFKRKNAGSMPGESGGYYQRLDLATVSLRNARLELQEADNRRKELNRQLRSESPDILIDGLPFVDPQDAKIAKFQQRLDDLLVRFTSRHPQVQQLRDTIEELKAQKARSPNSLSGIGNQKRQSSPIYQKMRTMQSEAAATVAQLRVRVAAFEKQVNQLEGTIDSIPKVEAELTQLDRDYSIVKKQHVTLLQRREAARLSEQVEQSSGDIKFSVVDPPFVPSAPIAPSKRLLTIMILIVSALAGITVSVFTSLLRPSYYNQRMLSSATGLPTLGTIRLARSPAQKLRSMMGGMVFGSLVAALFFACLIVRFLHTNGSGKPIVEQIVTGDVVRHIADSDFFGKTGISDLRMKFDELTESTL